MIFVCTVLCVRMTSFFFFEFLNFSLKIKKTNLTRSQNESFALRRQVSRSSSYSIDFTSYFLLQYRFVDCFSAKVEPDSVILVL